MEKKELFKFDSQLGKFFLTIYGLVFDPLQTLKIIII